jgi:hypothetical protein
VGVVKMVYDEWYGELSYAQRAAYRKHNVTPYEHDRLVEHFGQSAHAEITAAVKGGIGAQGMFDLRIALAGA